MHLPLPRSHLALAVAATASLLAAAAAPAAFPGKNGKIVFVDDGDIHSITPDGSDRRRLTPIRCTSSPGRSAGCCAGAPQPWRLEVRLVSAPRRPRGRRAAAAHRMPEFGRGLLDEWPHAAARGEVKATREEGTRLDAFAIAAQVRTALDQGAREIQAERGALENGDGFVEKFSRVLAIETSRRGAGPGR